MKRALEIRTGSGAILRKGGFVCHQGWRTLLGAVLILSTFVGLAQGDGPRAYWPAPKGTQALTPLYVHVNSNSAFETTLFSGGADFNTDSYGLMYSNVFGIGGRTAAVVAMVNYGRTEGGIRGVFEGERSGLADTYVVGVLNLHGAPSVTLEEYLKTQYKSVVDITFSFRAPTGLYDADRFINIGTNRWEFKLGFPMMHFLNWGTNHVTSFELLPSYSLFTNNNDISGGETLSQNGLFSLEGHVTQKMARSFWVSFDYQYKNGGQTETDGVSNQNLINVLMLGGTLGYDFTPKLGGYVSYGGVVATTSNGMVGNMLKFLLSYKF